MVCAPLVLRPAVLIVAKRTRNKPPLEATSTLQWFQTLVGFTHGYVFLAIFVAARIFVPTACDMVADVNAVLVSFGELR